MEGILVKDLRVLGPAVSPKDVALVDNATYSFGFQLDNGIPILPFYGDPHDEELRHLKAYLEAIKDTDDFRT